MKTFDAYEKEYDIVMNMRNYKKSVNKSSYLRYGIMEDVKEWLNTNSFDENC